MCESHLNLWNFSCYSARCCLRIGFRWYSVDAIPPPQEIYDRIFMFCLVNRNLYLVRLFCSFLFIGLMSYGKEHISFFRSVFRYCLLNLRYCQICSKRYLKKAVSSENKCIPTSVSENRHLQDYQIEEEVFHKQLSHNFDSDPPIFC